jgi:hypothetical protein
MVRPKSVSCFVVPTGVGAHVGGYAGDATPSLRLLASVTDVMITHPNVLNASLYCHQPDNALYVEGYGLNQFFRGAWGLQPVRQNRIGIIWDAGIPASERAMQHNVVRGVQQLFSLSIPGQTVTEQPVRLRLTTGATTQGELENPEVLYDAAKQLIQTHQVTALAVCVLFPNEPEGEANYAAGNGVDPVGGLEAIISHYLTACFHVPVAHAPVFADASTAAPTAAALATQPLDPRVALEYITPSFIPCILQGLNRAPAYVPSHTPGTGVITVADLSHLVVPHNTLGGLPMLTAMARGIPVVMVADNTTQMTLPPEAFQPVPDVVQVRNYTEAAGWLQAHRLGLTNPA